jgi:hypothetical protein
MHVIIELSSLCIPVMCHVLRLDVMIVLWWRSDYCGRRTDSLSKCPLRSASNSIVFIHAINGGTYYQRTVGNINAHIAGI